MKNIFYAPVGKDFRPYLETYWQIDPQTVLFSKENGAFQAKIRTDITIHNDTGIITEEHYILATSPVRDGAQLNKQNILDLRRYELQPGKYLLSIKFSDELKDDNQLVYKDSFIVTAISAAALSDIQLIDTTIASDKQNIFSRNGQLQIPLCANFLDEHRNTLHYYAELYQPNNKVAAPLICKAFISNKEFDIPTNRLLKIDTLGYAQVQLIEDKFSLLTLASGNYYLNIVIENFARERLSSKSFFFQLMNAKPESVSEKNISDTTVNAPVTTTTFLDLNKTFVGKYNRAQVRAILKMLVPIADPNERTNINGFLKNPDDTYTRYFIYNFWLRRNKLAPEEGWKEYANKVKEVNKLFGSSLLIGYESERGITYLKYGAPTERIIVNNESNALPYELWQYNSLPNASNALFLFYRPGLVTNDYRLLHTTVTGEIRNRNWRRNLYINGASTDAASSRAEQHIGNR